MYSLTSILLAKHRFINLPDWDLLKNFILLETAKPFESEVLHWEWLVLALALLSVVYFRAIPAPWLFALRSRFHDFAQKRSQAVWACILFPIILRLVLLPAAPVMPPSVQDEFSLLLQADTFRSGRLTNPTHPFWRHFETIQVIQRPTYNSMYPPASGVLLALGALVGNPWLGLLLSVGLMCGAICWMLQSWVPPAWALGGAIIAALQIAIGSFWVNSYLGAAPVPAMAGALLFGAMPRFLRKPNWEMAAVFALATILLINTRPLEGTILCLACFSLASWWRWRGVMGKTPLQWSVFLPGLLVFIFGMVFTCYYSWRVTGNPLRMPYVVNRDTYGWPENLAILPPKKITYVHINLRNMHNLELYYRTRYASLGRLLNSWCNRAVIVWEFYAGPQLTLPLLLLPWTIRNPRQRALFYIALLMVSLNALQFMAYPQHLSPETSIFFALIIGGMRHIYVQAHRMGVMPERLMASVVLSVTCGTAIFLFMEQWHISRGNFWEHPYWPYREMRAAMVTKLEQMPGQHLVIVRYAKNHSPHEEWVYNSADIDKSKIVWANSIGQKEDAELRRYFYGRQAWIVEPDKDQYSLWPLTKKTYLQ